MNNLIENKINIHYLLLKMSKDNTTTIRISKSLCR